MISQFNRCSTDFLRFIAILLITNSHLDSLYPIPQLATGGAIGNALFFMLSGYGLALSNQRKERPFLEWYGRRMSRIYPSLILVVAIFHFGLWGGWKTWAVTDYVKAFIWPTPAWFISALMIFYILLFGLMRMKKPQVYLIGMVLLLIPYFYFYFTSLDLTVYSIEGPSHFKWIFYLQVMLFGAYLSHVSITPGKIRHFLILFFCIILYYSLLVLISRGAISAVVQAISHALLMLIIYLFFRLSQSSFVIERLMASKSWSFMISFIAGLTLEIYLLQGTVYTNRFIQHFSFPVNILAFWITVITFALLTNRIAALFRRASTQLFKN